MNVTSFKQLPILGILRGVKEEDVSPLVQCILESGLKTIEVTMNTPNAPDLIRRIVKAAQGQLTIGAGTVLTKKDMERALEAGATFIVSPTLVPDVVSFCKDQQIPVFPGALTPQEILNAWQAGATMVKVFPSSFLGPDYFKTIKAPFNDIELLACGGVTADNIGTYFSKGASGIAFGSSIFRQDWIAAKDYSKTQVALKTLIDAFLKGADHD